MDGFYGAVEGGGEMTQAEALQEARRRILERYPEAQAEERYYGKGTARCWIVFPAPWRGPELGRGKSPEAAFADADRRGKGVNYEP
jgi:hypothetical protein